MNSTEKSKRMGHSLITKALLLPMLVLALVLGAATANAAVWDISVTPSGNDAPIKGNVVITFDVQMDDDPRGGATVELTSLLDQFTLKDGNWSNGNKTYTIEYSGLSYGTKYVVHIINFEDTQFILLQIPFGTYSFTTRPAPVAPVVSGKPSGKEPKPESAKPETAKAYEKAKVGHCNEWINVRSGPGTGYGIIGTAYLGETIELLEWNVGETWCKVLYNNGNAMGWIHGKFIVLAH